MQAQIIREDDKVYVNGRNIISIKVDPYPFQWQRISMHINQSNFKKNFVIGPSRNISQDDSERRETLNIFPCKNESFID